MQSKGYLSPNIMLTCENVTNFSTWKCKLVLLWGKGVVTDQSRRWCPTVVCQAYLPSVLRRVLNSKNDVWRSMGNLLVGEGIYFIIVIILNAHNYRNVNNEEFVHSFIKSYSSVPLIDKYIVTWWSYYPTCLQRQLIYWLTRHPIFFK